VVARGYLVVKCTELLYEEALGRYNAGVAAE
jgi:hypothetical protein